MLSGLFSKKETEPVNWTNVSTEEQLEELHQKSFEEPVLLFKHSTRCAISSMTLDRFERNYSLDSGFKPYFLDLIVNRQISNKVAEKYQVMHESPQAILIYKGNAVHDESHTGIVFEDISKRSRELS